MQAFFNVRHRFLSSLVLVGSLSTTPLSHAQQKLPVTVADEVVVTATRFKEKYLDTPVNVTVITAEDIKNSPAKTLPDLLSEQAGINVQDFFGNNAATTTVDMRGFGVTGGQNTLILIDGRRLGDIDLSGVQWSAIPFAAIERIEIVRGSGAVLYGDGASAGVINIITRSPVAGGRTANLSTRAVYAHNTTRLTERATVVVGWRSERFKINANDAYDPTAPGGAFGSGAPAAAQTTSVYAYELGTRYQVAPTFALVGKFGRSYRFANVDETYGTTPAFTAQFQLLRPQINVSTEIGAEMRDKRGNLRAALFNINVTDEVHLDAFSAGIGNTNLPPSRRRGLELDGRWKASETLTVGAAYTYTDARFREGTLPGGGGGGAFFPNVVIAGKHVPLVPQHKANLTASWAFTTKTRLSAAAGYVASQFMDNDEANTLGVTIPAYTVVDLKLAHEQGPWAAIRCRPRIATTPIRCRI